MILGSETAYMSLTKTITKPHKQNINTHHPSNILFILNDPGAIEHYLIVTCTEYKGIP